MKNAAAMTMTQKFWKRSLALAVAGMLAMSPVAMAQEEAAAPGANPGAGDDVPDISVSVGLDFTTQYFFRGILQEDQGVIAQPYTDLGVTFYQGDDGDGLNYVTGYAGMWHSLHSEHTGSSGLGPDIWYEADIYGGIGVGLFDFMEVGLGYTAYTSPNDAFGTVEEINLSFSFDDSSMWEDTDIPGFTGLAPHIAFAFETDGAADGGDEGIYLELGIEPSITPLADSLPDLTLSIPLTLGLSVDNYYEDASGADETFGFFDAGFVFSHPINSWMSVSAGVHLLWLGQTNQEINNNDDLEVIGTIGVSAEF